MKKITVAISIIFFFFFYPVGTLNTNNQTISASKVVIKNDCFTKAYSCTVNGVRLVVKKGTSYKGFVALKTAVKSTDPCFLEGLYSITFTTANILVESEQMTADELSSMSNPPKVLGVWGIQKGQAVMYILNSSDADKIMEIYCHELIHHIYHREGNRGNDVCCDKKFQKICQKIKTFEFQTEEVRKWAASLKGEEILATFGAYSYTEATPYYNKFVKEECPEFKAFLDSWFADIKEKYYKSE